MTDLGITSEQQADHDYRRWVHMFDNHMSKIPEILSMLVELSSPTIGVSRGGSRFDRAQVTGGGYGPERDLLSTIAQSSDDDGVNRFLRDAKYLWWLLTEYAKEAWDSIDTAVAQTIPDLPAGMPNSPRVAKDSANTVVGWLETIRPALYLLPRREEIEDELFPAVRHLRDTHGIHSYPRKEMCHTCGRYRLEVDYVDTKSGGVLKVGVCRNCGEIPEPEQIEEGTGMNEHTNHPNRSEGANS